MKEHQSYELQPERPAAQMLKRRIFADQMEKFGWTMQQVAKLETLNRYEKKYGSSEIGDFFITYDRNLERALADERADKGVNANVADFLQGSGGCYKQVEELYNQIQERLTPEEFEELQRS